MSTHNIQLSHKKLKVGLPVFSCQPVDFIRESCRLHFNQLLTTPWTMYVCIEVALREDAHGIGCSNWAKGRDPSVSWVQYPNPAVPWILPRHSPCIILAHYVRFLIQLYSRQLRVSCFLMYRRFSDTTGPCLHLVFGRIGGK